MNAADITALSQLAQGDGEMRLSKRLMRTLLAQMVLANTIHRTQDMVQRSAGSVVR